jgi:hypothetical protein
MSTNEQPLSQSELIWTIVGKPGSSLGFNIQYHPGLEGFWSVQLSIAFGQK